MNHPLRALLALSFVALAGGTALADDATFTFQGTLTDLDGMPLTDAVDVTFTLYDAATDGAVLWQEVKPALSVYDGELTVVLGDEEPLPTVSPEAGLWLGIQVDSEDEFAPRMKVGATLRARYADEAGDVTMRPIHPASVSIGETLVIDESGAWVGPSSGLAGPQGDAGEQGPKGDTGDVGPKGDQGDVGPKGDQGDVGPKGDQGDVGPKGDQGDVGPKGDQGDQGPQGEQGPAGLIDGSRIQRLSNPLLVENNIAFAWQHLCPQGWEVVAGGYSTDVPTGQRSKFAIGTSAPWTSGDRSGWAISGENMTGASVNFVHWMTCIRVD